MNEHRSGALPQRFLRRADVWTIVLVGALAAGAMLRFVGIGRYGFWTDELFHVFAASSYLKDGSFSVPWLNREYTRALPITLITALQFRLFGESEASARFFFALTNVVFIAVGYRVIRDMMSRGTALVFAVAISFSVFAIQMSQECRMYTVFQLFYFLMSVAFLRGLEGGPRSSRPGPEGPLQKLQQRHGVSLGFLVAALASGLAAASVQPLVLNFGFVAAVYCLLMLLHEWRRHGGAAAVWSKYLAVLFLGAAALLVALVLDPDRIAGLSAKVVQFPAWQETGETRLAFYQRIFREPHAILWALLPVGILTAIYRHGRTGLFFVLSFVVLFLLHSFVFQRRAERYVFYLLPFFLVVSATALVFVAEAVRERLVRLSRDIAPASRRILTAGLFVSAVWIAYPMILTTVADSSVAKFPNWKDLDPRLVRRVSDHPAMTTDRMRFNYYFRRDPDFVLGVEDLPDPEIVTDLDGFAAAVRRNPDLSLVTYRAQFYDDAFVSAPIRARVLAMLVRIDDARDDDRIMVFGPRPSDSGFTGGI